MTRKEFIKMFSLLGLGLPLQTTFSSCKKGPLLNPSDKVVIIGAGPAGLTAAYVLKQRGVEAQVLEALGSYGGRIKGNNTFTDFPISLGGEWLHVERSMLDEIVNDPSIQITTQTTTYNDNDYALYNGTQVSMADVGFTIDQKFVGSSWLDFFEQYVVPSIGGQILYNKVVNTIDYTGDKIQIQTAGETFEADKVIITVPVKVLQNKAITFNPALPNNKQNAIDNVTVWDGCKAFIEFTDKFYPAAIAFDVSPASAGQKLYYDAAYGQSTNKHILGLFAVGTGTLPYVNLSDSDLIAYMLNELDTMFNGRASASYVKHVFQNWNAEPYANGAYVYDQESWTRMRTLGESVQDRLFFAGDAYFDGNDWSSVHVAARSAKRVVDTLVH